MAPKMIKARVFRFDPERDPSPRYQEYQLPLLEGMSAMDVLDYIYQNLDSTLAYYDHAACALGICARCTGKINGRPGLFCQTLVRGDITLDPHSQKRLIRDLVTSRGTRQ